jgi:hypothetical protein
LEWKWRRQLAATTATTTTGPPGGRHHAPRIGNDVHRSIGLAGATRKNTKAASASLLRGLEELNELYLRFIQLAGRRGALQHAIHIDPARQKLIAEL